MDGILIIDKPATWTSHDVVGKLRKLLKTKRIGHTGTLDPFATGVLVMLVGQATRLAQFLDKDVKEYEATIQFGYETDTGDLTGMRKEGVTARSGDEVIEDEIREVLPQFLGEILQTPPMYSAKKIEGKKLYELARKGIEVERKPVAVTIYELELLNHIRNPQSAIRIRTACSAGTYIRTLAEDIGRKIGVPCHLSALGRIRAGKFSIEKAVSIEQLEEVISAKKLNNYLISMNQAVSHLPEKQLDEKEIEHIKHGRKIPASFADADVLIVRLTTASDDLLAIGTYDSESKLIQPRIVFTN